MSEYLCSHLFLIECVCLCVLFPFWKHNDAKTLELEFIANYEMLQNIAKFR